MMVLRTFYIKALKALSLTYSWRFPIMLICCIIPIYACGSKDAPYQAQTDNGDTGSLVFSVTWQDLEAAGDTITPMALDDCADISTVAAFLFDQDETLLGQGEWECSAHNGILEQITPGLDRRLTVLGLDASDAVIYRGRQIGIEVIAGRRTILEDPVVAASFVPQATASASETLNTISWAPVTGASTYNIYWATSSGADTSSDNQITGLAETSYDHTDLSACQPYYYVVTAVDSRGESRESAEVNATPGATPLAPGNVTVDAGNERIILTWNQVEEAVSYDVYWSTSSPVTQTSGTRIADVSSPYYHQNLTSGTAYYYVITAHSACKESPISDEVSTIPYALVRNCADLQAVADNPTGHYVVDNNIDCSDTASWNSGEGFIPIGTSSSPFAGSLNGGGYTIADLYINLPDGDYVGLFGYTNADADLIDIQLREVNVIGNYQTGALVGHNSGTISNCVATSSANGQVRGTGQIVGGLVGYNSGDVSSSSSAISIACEFYTAGGLIGENRGTISQCHATGPVTGKIDVGGLVGSNISGTIAYSYATGNVSGEEHIGGLSGDNGYSGAEIFNCYATGNVHGTRFFAGGLVGSNGGTGWGTETISNAYATGSVTGNAYVGGFTGSQAGGEISNCYAVGSVVGNNNTNVGGFAGTGSFDRVTDCFWDVDTSGQTVSYGGGTGKTTVEMMQAATFGSWDFADTWAILEGEQYPILSGTSSIIWYVKTTGADTNTGRTWDGAFETLSHAVETASDGDEIWIQAGNHLLDNQVYIEKSLNLYGGFSGTEQFRHQRDWSVNISTIDGQDRGYRCLYFTGNVLVDGLTITNASTGEGGGAIFSYRNSITIKNSRFTANSAQSAGAVYLSSASATIINCDFSDNTASLDGGAIYATHTAAYITNCRFSSNHASYGGALRNIFYSSPTIINCVFANNTAGTFGGGMYNQAYSSPRIINCTFFGNTAGQKGGGLLNWSDASPVITNCILWNNTAGIEGNEIYNNSAPVISHSDIQGGLAAIVNDGDGSVVDGGGNIDSLPLFVSSSDLHLQGGAGGSPCIDAGNNDVDLTDRSDIDEDGNTTEQLPFDYDQNPRLVDDTAIADTGNGAAPIIDIGAYETQ